MLLIFSASAAASNHERMGEWPMEEGSGQLAYDMSPNDLHGSFGGSSSETGEPTDPVWSSESAPEDSYSVEFDGDNDYIHLHDDSALNIDELSVTAAVKVDSYDPAANSVVSSTSGVSSDARALFSKKDSYMMAVYKNGTFVASVRSPDCGSDAWCSNSGTGYGEWVSSGFKVPKNKWTEVSFSWNGTHYKFYKNERLEKTVSPSNRNGYAAISDESTEFVFGSRYFYNSGTKYRYNHFDGKISFLSSWDAPKNFGDDKPVSVNYTNKSWQNHSVPALIECGASSSSCNSIRWRIEYLNGTEIRSGFTSSESTVVDVGSSANGELNLSFRGENSTSSTKWYSQPVYVDKIDPVPLINDPPVDRWYDSNFTVKVSDTDLGGSGIGMLYIKYVTDSSQSYFEEWDFLEANLSDIEQEAQSDSGVSLRKDIFALNNSYQGSGSGSGFICMNGQNVDPSPGCEKYSPFIDDVTNVAPYVRYLNKNEPGYNVDPSDYNPNARPYGTQETKEAPSEGWGIGLLDTYDRGWTGNSIKVAVVLADMDTNGGGNDPGDNPSCGDDISRDLADRLKVMSENRNISTFFMLGTPECDDAVAGYGSEAERQMANVGKVFKYTNKRELREDIKKAVDSQNTRRCNYRVGNTTHWTDWKNRGCPNGNFNVSVGEGFTCSAKGEDKCVVQAKVKDTAGNIGITEKKFNIGTVCGGDYDQANEPGEKNGRLKNDIEYCYENPSTGVSEFVDQDFGDIDGDGEQETCRVNRIYGLGGKRWITAEQIRDHPHAFVEGIDDDWTPYMQKQWEMGEYSSNLTSLPDQNSWDFSKPVTSVPTGNLKKTVATRGFCGGDDEGEILITQNCDTGLCSKDRSVIGVSLSPKSCILDGSRYDLQDASNEKRKIYDQGESVTFNLDTGDTKTVACFDNVWYENWPISAEPTGTVEVGKAQTTSFRFRLINIRETSKKFRVELQGDDSVTRFASFPGYNSDDSFTTTVPAKSGKYITVRFIC
jgi:hypothetical protein